MTKIKLSLIFVLAALLLPLAFSKFSLAKKEPPLEDNQEVPEVDGDYPDPKNKDVRVRVFVYKEKQAKVSTPSLVCSLGDPDSTAVVAKGNWHLPGSWTYNLNPASVPASVGSANLGTIAGNGFADWFSASGSKVTFTKGADTTKDRQAYDGKNIIAWGRTSGTALGVTYIRYLSSGGLVVDVDTIMNKKFLWSWSNSATCADTASYDAENILTHELGHWMGLNDMYDVANYREATMYGYGAKGEAKKDTLTTGDKAGAAAIYP